MRVRCRKACEVNIPSIPSSSGRVLPQVISACLFTGGSGFLGINLIRLLLARGVRVRSLDIAPFDYPERDRVEAILGDIRDAAAVARAKHGVDAVVHCAAALPLASAAVIVSTDVGGTQLLLDAAWQQQLPCCGLM